MRTSWMIVLGAMLAVSLFGCRNNRRSCGPPPCGGAVVSPNAGPYAPGTEPGYTGFSMGPGNSQPSYPAQTPRSGGMIMPYQGSGSR
ncbi:MAG: hypothetical protein N2C14_19550 [Planctomycetales bacterium]